MSLNPWLSWSLCFWRRFAGERQPSAVALLTYQFKAGTLQADSPGPVSPKQKRAGVFFFHGGFSFRRFTSASEMVTSQCLLSYSGQAVPEEAGADHVFIYQGEVAAVLCAQELPCFPWTGCYCNSASLTVDAFSISCLWGCLQTLHTFHFFYVLNLCFFSQLPEASSQALFADSQAHIWALEGGERWRTVDCRRLSTTVHSPSHTCPLLPLLL